MKCLVTGADGMLASDLIPMLSDAGVAVAGKTHGDFDITDLEACRRAAEGVDTIINCAAWTDVDTAEQQPDAVMRVNVEGHET
jgi:dTDP-4-dehydrorhamnose reductase